MECLVIVSHLRKVISVIPAIDGLTPLAAVFSSLLMHSPNLLASHINIILYYIIKKKCNKIKKYNIIIFFYKVILNDIKSLKLEK